MHEGRIDIVGWFLAIVVVALATFIAFKLDSQVGAAIAIALLALVAIEKRRSKVISASLIQISDEKGGIRGLIGYDGSGVQLGVRTDPLDNGAVAYSLLWQEKPNVAFSFQAAMTASSSGVIDVAPEIWVRGQMQYEMRSFSMQFGYDTAAKKPAIHVKERVKEGTLVRDIQIS